MAWRKGAVNYLIETNLKEQGELRNVISSAKVLARDGLLEAITLARGSEGVLRGVYIERAWWYHRLFVEAAQALKMYHPAWLIPDGRMRKAFPALGFAQDENYEVKEYDFENH